MISGGLLALCFPPFGIGMLVWVALVPLLVALWAGGGERRRGRFGFGAGYACGAVFWLINLKWLREVSGLGMVAVSLYLALYFALFGAFAAGAGNPWRSRRAHSGAWREAGRSLRFAALTALWWCGMEWVRGWMLTGFGWNGLGVTFHDTAVVAQSAELIGATGLAFIPVFLAAVLVQVGRRLHGEARRGKLKPHWDFGAAAALLGAVFLFGVLKLQGWKAQEVVPLKVLLVQLNIPQQADRVLWSREEVHAGYEEETIGALDELEESNVRRMEEDLAAGKESVEVRMPDWVLWPESALKEWLFYSEDGLQATGPFNRQTLSRVMSEASFTLLFGLNEIEAEQEGELLVPKDGGDSYNSLLVLPEGEDRFRSYRKQHLVMFGETIPYQDKIPFLARLYEMSAGVEFGGGFSSGRGDDPLIVPHAEAPDGEVAVIPSICFEDTVPRLLRKYVKNGGQLIVNVTNDGWFKQSEAAAQHFANARFRAIELRRPMVRCANTGVSTVVGANGSVHDPLTGVRRVLEDEGGNHLTRGWLFSTAYVPLDGPVTVYARFGDWLAAAGFAIGLGWWLTGRLRRD